MVSVIAFYDSNKTFFSFYFTLILKFEYFSLKCSFLGVFFPKIALFMRMKDHVCKFEVDVFTPSMDMRTQTKKAS